MSEEIIKPKQQISKKFKVGAAGGLRNRIKDAQEQLASSDPLAMPNRIGLMLDLSSSMSGGAYGHGSGYGDRNSKIDHLIQATESFARTTDYANTAIAIESFPTRISVPLTSNSLLLQTQIADLRADGGTPMGTAMSIIRKNSLTRGVLISDGGQTDGNICFNEAEEFAEAGIPIDCIHIGTGRSGEETLRQIAHITKGIYIKFKDSAQLAEKLHYLTPAFRGLLVAGNAKEILGADEVE